MVTEKYCAKLSLSATTSVPTHIDVLAWVRLITSQSTVKCFPVGFTAKVSKKKGGKSVKVLTPKGFKKKKKQFTVFWLHVSLRNQHEKTSLLIFTNSSTHIPQILIALHLTGLNELKRYQSVHDRIQQPKYATLCQQGVDVKLPSLTAVPHNVPFQFMFVPARACSPLSICDSSSSLAFADWTRFPLFFLYFGNLVHWCKSDPWCTSDPFNLSQLIESLPRVYLWNNRIICSLSNCANNISDYFFLLKGYSGINLTHGLSNTQLDQFCRLKTYLVVQLGLFTMSPNQDLQWHKIPHCALKVQIFQLAWWLWCDLSAHCMTVLTTPGLRHGEGSNWPALSGFWRDRASAIKTRSSGWDRHKYFDFVTSQSWGALGLGKEEYKCEVVVMIKYTLIQSVLRSLSSEAALSITVRPREVAMLSWCVRVARHERNAPQWVVFTNI